MLLPVFLALAMTVVVRQLLSLDPSHNFFLLFDFQNLLADHYYKLSDAKNLARHLLKIIFHFEVMVDVTFHVSVWTFGIVSYFAGSKTLSFLYGKCKTHVFSHI
jgi:hypothetical protein